MRKKVRVAIAGVGNCASALVQGTFYYDRLRHHKVDLHTGTSVSNDRLVSNRFIEKGQQGSSSISSSSSSDIKRGNETGDDVSDSILDGPGLVAYNLGGIEPSDIEFVAAFDVVESKVGRDLAEAIFADPNNTIKICDVDKIGVKVDKGEVL